MQNKKSKSRHKAWWGGSKSPYWLGTMTSDALGIITEFEPLLGWSSYSLKGVCAFVLISSFVYHSVCFTCNCTSRPFSHAKDECSFLWQPSMIWPIFSCHYQEREHASIINIWNLSLLWQAAWAWKKLVLTQWYLGRQGRSQNSLSAIRADERFSNSIFKK